MGQCQIRARSLDEIRRLIHLANHRLVPEGSPHRKQVCGHRTRRETVVANLSLPARLRPARLADSLNQGAPRV